MIVVDEITGEEEEVNIKDTSDLYSFIQSVKKKIKNKNKK